MTSWTREQLDNAKLIVKVGQALNMSQRDIITALMTAMTESSLRNQSGGDKDSAGLFQQRPSQGWGTKAQVTDPLYATRNFYETLKTFEDRMNMQPWEAAQRVQRSAYPDAYKRWLGDAQKLAGMRTINPASDPVQELSDVLPTGFMAFDGGAPGFPNLSSVADSATLPGPEGVGPRWWTVQTGGDTQPGAMAGLLDEVSADGSTSPARQQVIDIATSYIGTPYKWGGTTPGKELDCSGLLWAAFQKAGASVVDPTTGKARSIPRVSYDQALLGPRTAINKLSPGDFVVFGSDAHHIALYLGNGKILEAQQTGTKVHIRSLGKGEDAWGVHLSY